MQASSFYQPSEQRLSAPPRTAFAAPPPAPSRLDDVSHFSTSPPLGESESKISGDVTDFSHIKSLPFGAVLFATVSVDIRYRLEEFSTVYQNFPDADKASLESGRAVTATFNACEPVERNILWSDWVIFSTLCRALAVPVFPIQPDKVAIILAVHTDLPVSKVLRYVSLFDQVPTPELIPRVLIALQRASLATRHLWPDIPCLVRSGEEYESIRVLLSGVPQSSAPSHSTSAYVQPAPPPPPLNYQPPPPPPVARPPPATAHLPAAPPQQAPRALKPEPATPILHIPDGSLRALAEDLPEALGELQTEPNDPRIFDIAGHRFQETANSPAFADRVASLHNTAVIYTHITALLSFPTYPITTLKLGVFALAMTPGPLGKRLDEVAPHVQEDRECPRATGKQLETLLRDATALREITRGGEYYLADSEKVEWASWWREVTRDWQGPDAAKKRPSQSGKKRTKRSVSPGDYSDGSTTSSKRFSGVSGRGGRGGAAARQPKSRLLPDSRTSSRSNTPTARAYGQKKGANDASWSGFIQAEPIVWEHWTPARKGVLPASRREPPLPPILECPWWVPKKKKVKVVEKPAEPMPMGISNAAATGLGTGMMTDDAGPGVQKTEEEEEEEEEDAERKKQMQGRSIALHRPKRGGLDMQPFDVSLLWW